MIIDDEQLSRDLLKLALESDYRLLFAASGQEALDLLAHEQPDIILLDIILPDSNGLDLLESIITACPESKVVVCSSIGQEQVIQKSLDLGAKAFIQKPFTPEKVTEVLESLEV